MSVRRRDIEGGLRRAERAIALVERCSPIDAADERARVWAEWQRGNQVAPGFRYAAVTGFSELRQSLEHLATQAAELGEWGRLYAERARELAVEAELAEQIGSPSFAELAARRYGADAGRDGAQAARWAEEWTAAPPEPEPAPGIASDDEKDPRSLVACMRRVVGERRLPFRVLVRRELLAAAATGEGVIVVRGGARYGEQDVRRVVTHEVVGHAMPRARAQREELGLFALGTAGGSDDEEGRALLAELRADCLGARRKAELGRRHLAALAVRAGADWVETVRLLRERGAPIDEALTVAARVHRGGGLAREVVYLTALSRVVRAFDRDPSIESWLERGRISVAAVPVLRELGDPPELIRAPRAA